MPQIIANGITLEYERSGPSDGLPLLLIHGVGAQLIRWPTAFCESLAAAGFAVIRYDSRDIGLSTHMHGAPIPDLEEVMAAVRRGDRPALPYTLSDLAADAAGLLDALAIDRAHVLGVSLGGMVAQQLAIEHPASVRSLAIMMSTTGNPNLPGAQAQALAALTAPAPNPEDDMEASIQHSVALNRVLGGPDYLIDEAQLRAFAEMAARRAYDPAGAARQLAAGRGAPDRRHDLRSLRVPTLVIHGSHDPLIPIMAGEDIARNVAGSWLLALRGMGHDLPEPLFDIFTSAIAANARRAVAEGANGSGEGTR